VSAETGAARPSAAEDPVSVDPPLFGFLVQGVVATLFALGLGTGSLIVLFEDALADALDLPRLWDLASVLFGLVGVAVCLGLGIGIALERIHARRPHHAIVGALVAALVAGPAFSALAFLALYQDYAQTFAELGDLAQQPESWAQLGLFAVSMVAVFGPALWARQQGLSKRQQVVAGLCGTALAALAAVAMKPEPWFAVTGLTLSALPLLPLGLELGEHAAGWLLARLGQPDAWATPAWEALGPRLRRWLVAEREAARQPRLALQVVARARADVPALRPLLDVLPPILLAFAVVHVARRQGTFAWVGYELLNLLQGTVLGSVLVGVAWAAVRRGRPDTSPRGHPWVALGVALVAASLVGLWAHYFRWLLVARLILIASVAGGLCALALLVRHASRRWGLVSGRPRLLRVSLVVFALSLPYVYTWEHLGWVGLFLGGGVLVVSGWLPHVYVLLTLSAYMALWKGFALWFRDVGVAHPLPRVSLRLSSHVYADAYLAGGLTLVACSALLAHQRQRVQALALPLGAAVMASGVCAVLLEVTVLWDWADWYLWWGGPSYSPWPLILGALAGALVARVPGKGGPLVGVVALIVALGWAWERVHVPPAFAKASVKALWRQAQGGDATAMRELGERYAMGVGIHRDQAEAHAWLVRAAEGGDSEAMYRLGVAYTYGRNCRRDPEVGAGWIAKAAAAGEPRAQAFRGAGQ
jgi:hypothetical protein